MENFSHDGNIPEAKVQLHIYAKGELVFVHAFNILVGISYPIALEHLKDFLFFSISIQDVNFLSILSIGFVKLRHK
jgi:hypothetical protein